MCNETQMRLDFGDWWWTHGRVKKPGIKSRPAMNRAMARPYKPTDEALVLRPVDPENVDDGLELVPMRWWLVPFFHKGPVKAWRHMATNARIEEIETTASFRAPYKQRRMIWPITSMVEYDTPPGWKPKQPKRRWEITWEPNDEFDQVRYLAGVWDRARPSDLAEPMESFAIITGPPGPDIAQVHTREAALLTWDDAIQWLWLDGPGKAGLVTETPAGTYQLTERVRPPEAAGPLH